MNLIAKNMDSTIFVWFEDQKHVQICIHKAVLSGQIKNYLERFSQSEDIFSDI